MAVDGRGGWSHHVGRRLKIFSKTGIFSRFFSEICMVRKMEKRQRVYAPDSRCCEIKVCFLESCQYEFFQMKVSNYEFM